MVLPVRNVSRTDRGAAYGLASLILLALIIGIGATVFQIIWNRDHPPTTTAFIDGQAKSGGSLRWGRMPYLLVRTQKVDGEIRCLPMTDTYYHDTGLGKDGADTFQKLSEPSCTSINPGAVLIDFTVLEPIFQTKEAGGGGPNKFEFPHPPTIDIRFIVNRSDGVDLFFIDPAAPKTTLGPPWTDSMDMIAYIGGIGDISDDTGQYVHTQVAKNVVPKAGAFWGFSPFDSHTEEKYEFTYSGYHPKKVPLPTKSNSQGVNLGWRIQIPTSVMMERKPISVISQLLALISTIGGWMTMATTLFFCVFVQKYPPSEEELLSAQMALRWRTRETRETSEAELTASV